jgi:hypothetical protein
LRAYIFNLLKVVPHKMKKTSDGLTYIQGT